MTLQTENLTMIGLGVQGDVPPNSAQPTLVDGIHLRWMCEHDLGLPWFGFHLFRRPSQDGKPRCLAEALTRFVAQQPAPVPLAVPVGRLDSDVPIAFTEDFPPAGRPEVDLRSRLWTRLTLPSGEPAYRADVTIGLRENVGQPVTKRTCIDFRKAKASTGANPRKQDGVTFTVRGADGKAARSTVVRPYRMEKGELSGLDCDFGLEARLPCPAVEVELTLTNFGTPGRVSAVNGSGATVASASITPPPGVTQTILLSGTGIVAVIVSAPTDETALHQICFRCPGDAPAPGKGIEVVALSDQVEVASAAVTGHASQVETVTLRFDQITAIEVRGGPAALIDICVWFVTDGAAVGWQRLSDFPNPLSLPVRHPDYPSSGGQSANLAVAEAVALARVRYGPSIDWQGSPFADLHTQLTDLVQGGPSATPMAARTQTYTDTSSPADPSVEPAQLSKQSILDLLLLASLHPALAQILGLYWVDQTAATGVAYDYLIVADHTGVGNRDAQHVLAVIAGSGFTQLDGWIAFGLRAAPASPLDVPTDLQAYSLPDTDIAAAADDGSAPVGTGTVGLRWALPTAGDSDLEPGAAVLYHLWRADLGNQAAPQRALAYKLVTTDGAVLVTTPVLATGTVPDRPSDLPPLPMHTMDSGLADGWYAYAVCGVDLFGRLSANSAPAAWHQWEPTPEPRPWYYTDPPGDRVVHPSAVRVLDKTPPPAPSGVEAYALDPLDGTVVRDPAFFHWWATLKPDEQPSLVGLRVSWRWTEAQMLQAPDTAEFRIYFHVGTDPPGPDSHDAPSWDERRHVVGYGDAEHVTATVDADGKPVRLYEVFLPTDVDTVRDSLPLVPNLQHPIAYGHVGVSAADGQRYTGDDPKWAAGHWGGRIGNEGRVGPLAKVWRVRRDKPLPPSVPLDAERVFATPADYHSASFYTYRWVASPHLKTHVFRAMDESVYRVDWATREGRTSLTASDPVFPAETVDPRWNPAKRQQVADELNVLNGFDPLTETGVAAAMAYYRNLSNDALRVLASLPETIDAFAQVTLAPLDPDDLDPDVPPTADRPGPDNPPTYVPRPDLRIFVDTLDGRSTNRYFYRAAYVDNAHNRGKLSLSGPSVCLPKVVPPRTPVITSVAGGELSVTLRWAANREPDLAEYRVYRTDVEADAADIRSMMMVHAHALATPDVEWTDRSDILDAHRYFYRLTAADTVGNESAATREYVAVAVDTRVPSPPVWTDKAWLLRSDQDGLLVEWPQNGPMPAGYTPVLRLEWESDTVQPEFVVARLGGGERVWAEPAEATVTPSQTTAGRYVLLDSAANAATESWYRLRVRSRSGIWSTDDSIIPVTPPRGA